MLRLGTGSVTRANGQSTLGIYSQGVFKRLVKFERCRSDRLNAPISLVVVTVRSHRALGAFTPFGGVTAASINALTTRARGTDSVGWLDAMRVAVLLPNTDEAGACRFAESVQGELPRLHAPIEISTHPDSPELTPIDATAINGAAETVTAHPAEPQLFPFSREASGGVVRGSALARVLVRPVPLWKRAIDVAGSSIGLLICAPLLAAVALYIKSVSPGPIIFSQNRIGLGGREFRFYKFRTMHHNNDQDFHSRHATDFIRNNGNMLKLDRADPRIFFGGRLLRLLCIDELPQLYNILRGDMSLVGPRPCIPYEAAEYQRWHRHRFSILPGLTGLWQVSGKNRLSFAEMIRLDIQYERTISPITDIIIILRTIPTIIGLFAEAVGRKLAQRRDRAAATAPGSAESDVNARGDQR